jgi:gamma-glutamyl:cysteine ligase YbdK (ATP-grasp superfamily)
MGLEIDRTEFDESDYADFAVKLRSDLAALAELLKRPGFGEGPTSIGAEIEFALVDAEARPCPINGAVIRDALDPQLALELDRFNLEYNATPVGIAGRPFSALAGQLRNALEHVDDVAAEHGGRVALVGILPTLRREDLQSSAMTESPRFQALSQGLRQLRAAPFHISIEGDESLDLDCDDVTMEGANTSLQLHLRVAPSEFARTFNAAQLAAAPALAIGSNSPIFLSRMLWHETRVALFGKAVDYRMEGAGWRPARVSFGHGWIRESALECFEESVALHTPLLPVVSKEDPQAVVAAGGVPQLGELKLHHGTVWSWNRAIYGADDGGHLRIELRSLPTGPTVADMVANAAFLIGLTLGLRDRVDRMVPAIPFRLAHDNFYRAARAGLDSILLWPAPQSPSPLAHRAADLIPALLPIARRGLEGAGVDGVEADEHLGVIERRVRAGTTGACWQRQAVARLEGRMSRGNALAEMLVLYIAQMREGRPVEEWALP